MLQDCEVSAWDGERIAIWHVLITPFKAALGNGIRTTIESVMKPGVTYADTFALFSLLKRMLDESQTVDAANRASAEAALHEARGMMATFLKHQRQNT